MMVSKTEHQMRKEGSKTADKEVWENKCALSKEEGVNTACIQEYKSERIR